MKTHKMMALWGLVLAVAFLATGCSITRLNVHQDAKSRDNKSWQVGFPTLESSENAGNLQFNRSHQTPGQTVRLAPDTSMVMPQGCGQVIDPGWTMDVPGQVVQESGSSQPPVTSSPRVLFSSGGEGAYYSGADYTAGFRGGYFNSQPYVGNYSGGYYPPVTYLPAYRPPPEVRGGGCYQPPQQYCSQGGYGGNRGGSCPSGGNSGGGGHRGR